MKQEFLEIGDWIANMTNKGIRKFDFFAHAPSENQIRLTGPACVDRTFLSILSRIASSATEWNQDFFQTPREHQLS